MMNFQQNYQKLKSKIDELNGQKETETKKELEFSDKIDELNQETDSLLEEIDKWANVNIKFNNKEFLLSCEDGQEEHLEELSFHLSEKFNKLKSTLGNIGENKLLLITSITTMDEYFETKKKIDQKIEELKKSNRKI